MYRMPFRKIYIFLLFLIICILGISLNVRANEQVSSKVKVIQASFGEAIVTVEKISPQIKVLPVLSCKGPDFAKAYPNYSSTLDKRAKCMTGYTEASLIKDKKSDSSISIGLIDTRLNSLRKTIAYLNNLKDLDGLSLVALPAGFVDNIKHDTAKKISMQCLSSGNTIEDEVAVGDYAAEDGQVFAEISPEQLAIIAKVRTDNRNIQKKIQDERARTGKISKGTIINLAMQSLELKKLMEKNFIPILIEDQKKDYKNMVANNDYLGLNISYKLDQNNKRVTHSIPFFIKPVASMAGISGPLVDADLSIDEVTFTTQLPDATMLKEFKESALKHIERLEGLKDQFVNSDNSLNKKLQQLEKVNYYCS